MGIVILPVILGAATCYVISIYHLVKGIKQKIFSLSAVLIGIFIPVLILTCNILIWTSTGAMQVFAPILNISMVMFILPIVVFLSLWSNNKPAYNFTMKIAILTVFFSGTGLIFFGAFLNDFIVGLDLKISH